MILRRIKNRLKFERKELPLRINFLLRLYKYNPDRYKGTFLYDLQSNKSVQSFPKPTLNEVVYCFWTGHNAMSANRQRCLASMKENIGVPLIRTTDTNYSRQSARIHLRQSSLAQSLSLFIKCS